jgi:hypothetical protein
MNSEILSETSKLSMSGACFHGHGTRPWGADHLFFPSVEALTARFNLPIARTLTLDITAASV